MKTVRTMRDLRSLKTKRLKADTVVRVKNRRTDRTYVLNATKNHDTLTAMTWPRVGLTPSDFESLANNEIKLSVLIAARRVKGAAR